MEELYQERTRRIMEAVALERPDRIPMVHEYAGFAAHATGTVMADFLGSPSRATEVMIQAYHLIGEGDGINYGSFAPQGLSRLFMSRVRVPGIDLPAEEMWQVEETELMKPDDYDRLLEMGWPAFFEDFMDRHIRPGPAQKGRAATGKPLDVRGAWREIGVPVLSGGDISPPMELLCGARSLMGFSNDLFKIPDKVEAALEEMVGHLAGPVCAQAREKGYPAVWVGGWRAAPSMISPAFFDRFAWPYLRLIVNEVVDSGLIAILHLDSDWTRELNKFRELPPGRCILATDGETDLRRAKQVLGDNMCLMGDVPASLLYLGQPEEVREYCRGLIKDLGPEGFILQSGCDTPTNARVENVRAMAQAVLG